MKNLNLYNKYRPRCFAEVVGQTLVKDLIIQIFNRNKLLQSFIFYGPHGTGKTSLARIFAKAWNCDTFQEVKDVCNCCDKCRLIDGEQTTDIYEVDAASYSGVDHMRELIQNSQYLPLHLNKKVYIIDEAHNLSSLSWNVMLKAIEEPFESVIFIFLTTNIQKIPETILSRCQKYNFPNLSDDEIRELIVRVVEKEGREIDERSLGKLVTLSRGSARECLSLLDQVLLRVDQSITMDRVEDILSLTNRERVLELARMIMMDEVGPALDFLDGANTPSKNWVSLFAELLTLLIDLEVYRKSGSPEYLNFLTPQEVSLFRCDGVNLISLMGILESSIASSREINNQHEWAKILLFKLMEDCENKRRDFSEAEERIILFGLTSSNIDGELSRRNYTIHGELIRSGKFQGELVESLRHIRIIQEKIISTPRTVVVLYDELSRALEFNRLVSLRENQELLERIFMGNFHWVALTAKQFKTYYAQAQKTPVLSLDVPAKNDFFEGICDILK